MIQIALSGAAGRMGRRIIALAMEDASTKNVAATEPAGSPMLGQDTGQLAGVSPTGIKITPRVETDFDVFIDFSTASATREWLDLCESKAKPIIIGTTGHSDADLAAIREAADRIGLYLMNSVNPFRLEGQKTIMYRVLEALRWEVPDWIVVPGGNLGNTSAFGKAWLELKQLGLVSRIPRLAVINAAGANTLHELYNNHGLRWNNGNWNCDTVCNHYDEMTKQGHKASTIATAIEIARPVNLSKALRALDAMNGVVCEVTDNEILEEKALVGRFGFGCEPASAASVAGLRQLLANGTIDREARVVCILTGHALKDPDATVKYHTGIESKGVAISAGHSTPTGRHANLPIRVPDEIDAICNAIEAAG
ncbi:MAG: pyridoxal-phosphate dependent enzyme [Planctomycetes bacterium]|nr:pyridoxal-phosphate dependent enzyme [Planctomycetota bacterium]